MSLSSLEEGCSVERQGMASGAHKAVVCVRRSRGLVRKFGCDVPLSICGASF